MTPIWPLHSELLLTLWNFSDVCLNSPIEGRITNREYEARDGSGKRYRTEIVAQRVQFLGGRPAAGADEGAPDFNSGPDMPAADDEDIPFIVACDISPDRRFRM